MAVAIIYPEPAKTAPGRRSDAATASAAKSVSAEHLSLARAVLAYSRETGGKLHREVMRGPANGGADAPSDVAENAATLSGLGD